MKKLIHLALTGILFSQTLFAGNGAHLMALSPVSAGMGGTSVGGFTSITDAVVRNSANLGLLPGPGDKVTAQLDFFLAKNNVKGNAGSGEISSSAGAELIPQVGSAYKFDEDLSVGLAILTYGGAFSDFTGQPTALQLKGENQLFRIAPGVSYKVWDHLRVGLSPFLNYGRLALNHATSLTSPTGTQTNRGMTGATGFGAHFGVSSDVLAPVTVGVAYTTKSTLKYSGVVDLDAFGPNASAANSGMDDFTSEQPDELAAGVTWSATDALKVALDYRFIHWGGSTSYKKLGWTDQSVIGLGGQYTFGDWKVRAGFNYAKAPLNDRSGQRGLTAVDIDGHFVFTSSLSRLNAFAIPAIAESHLTLGGGYSIMENLELNSAFVYVFETTRTYAGTSTAAYSFTSKVSQWSASVGAMYRF